MRILSILGLFLGAFVKALFSKSNDERLGASEERAKILEKQIEIGDSMRRSKKISTHEELIKILKDGKLILFFCIPLLFLTSCSRVYVTNCQSVRPWSQKEQARMVIDQALLPKDSPIIGALVDYNNMRNEARECWKNGGNYAGK